MKKLILLLLVVIMITPVVSAAWWNDSWNNKQRLDIQENNDTNTSDLSVLIHIDFIAGMNSNFSDLRFIDSTETEELGYYIENKTDDTYANIYVKLNLTQNENTTIYMYYNNNDAASDSNISKAFIFGDDFSVNSTTLYNFNPLNCTFMAIENGYMNVTGPNSGSTCIVSPTIQPINDTYIVEINASYERSDTYVGVVGFQPVQNASSAGYAVQVNPLGAVGNLDIERLFIASLTNTNKDHAIGQWEFIGGTFLTGNISAFWQNATTNIPNLFTTDSTYSTGFYGIKTFKGAGVIDWFRVREHVFVEPTVNFGTIDSLTLTELGQNFNDTTFEFSRETFEVNITYNSSAFSSISANLIYNGTIYLGTQVGSGDDINFVREITIPTISAEAPENKTFVWEFFLTNSTDTISVNSSENQQTVNPTLFTKCNETFNEPEEPIVVNFSILDENNRTELNASFKATFFYSLGNTTEQKSTTFESVVDNSTFTFCGNSNETFMVDSIIKIEKDGYFERTYFFEGEEYNNQTTEQQLFLLNDTFGSNIIVEVKDAGLQPLENYIVNISRLYPESDEYLSVVSDKTDEFGQFVARLVENTVKYRFAFTDPNGIVRKVTDDVTIACRATFCVIPFVIEDTTDDFDIFGNVTDYDASLSFDNVTNIFTFSWNDVTGDSITSRLFVERLSFNGSIVVCNTTSTSTASTLTCDVGGERFNYRAQIFRQVTGENERRIGVLNIGVGQPSFGFEGLLWGFFLLFTLVAVGSFNPVVAIVLYLVGFVSLGVVGIFSLNLSVFFGMLTLCIIFIWSFIKTR